MSTPAQEDADTVDHLNHEPFVRGSMPIHEQTATFEKVFDKGLVRYGSLFVACLVLFLVLSFCTPAGLLTGLVVAIVLGAVGGFVLRTKPTSVETH